MPRTEAKIMGDLLSGKPLTSTLGLRLLLFAALLISALLASASGQPPLPTMRAHFIDVGQDAVCPMVLTQF
jgi:uncharacterized membrane protein